MIYLARVARISIHVTGLRALIMNLYRINILVTQLKLQVHKMRANLLRLIEEMNLPVM